MQQEKLPNKCFVYIDGYNLYYSIKDLNSNKLKWLDIGELVLFIISKDSCCEIKYFTAPGIRGEDTLRAQKDYWKAIVPMCREKGLEMSIIKGRHVEKEEKCPDCGHEFPTKPEEKQTDVNIACHMMKDLYEEENFKEAYLISGDTDLILPVRMCKKKGVNITVVFPPGRKNKQLANAATDSREITEGMLECFPLPKQVQGEKGEIIHRPKGWSD